MMRRTVAVVVCLTAYLSLSGPAEAQSLVADRNRHERVIAVVPLIGAGTYDDPKRPLFAPAPRDLGPDGQILGFRYQLGDDGQTAVVEIVARDRQALRPILESGRTDVKVFLIGKDTREDIEREVRKVKKDYDREKPPAGPIAQPAPGGAR
jgi:hypothetical protein